MPEIDRQTAVQSGMSPIKVSVLASEIVLTRIIMDQHITKRYVAP